MQIKEPSNWPGIVCQDLKHIKSEAKMRLTLLTLVGAITLLGTPAQAQNYPWCAQYSGRGMGGAQNCGFVSFAQCMATVSGIGGFCVQNTLYQPPAPRARKKKKAY
jgi:Protein of unknown function (DUF3551)